MWTAQRFWVDDVHRDKHRMEFCLSRVTDIERKEVERMEWSVDKKD